MDDINWHKVHASRLATCCQRAAADFNLSLTSPFTLKEGTPEECTFVAHFPHIGPQNGIVVCLAEDWRKLQDQAHAQGYTCVGVAPESCSSYEKGRWEAFVNEWNATSPES